MRHNTKIIAGCGMGLMLLMLSTEPHRLPSALLILPFLFIFVVFVFTLVRILRWQGMAAAKSVRLGLMGASLPLLVLLLQSLGQLTLRDLLTIVALFVIMYFYLSRVTRQASE